jgi:hypothetical protein
MCKSPQSDGILFAVYSRKEARHVDRHKGVMPV